MEIYIYLPYVIDLVPHQIEQLFLFIAEPALTRWESIQLEFLVLEKAFPNRVIYFILSYVEQEADYLWKMRFRVF